MEKGLAEFGSEIPCPFGSSLQIPVGEDDRPIGIQNVLLGALKVVLVGHLLEVVLVWKRTGFSQSSLWDPSSMGKAHFYRSIKSCLIDPCLTAADDFGEPASVVIHLCGRPSVFVQISLLVVFWITPCQEFFMGHLASL